MPDLYSWMINQMHKLVYAEDILFLNEANRKFDKNSPGPKVFCVALPAGVPEVKRFETSREVIFESVREGFAAAYNALVLDPMMKVCRRCRDSSKLSISFSFSFSLFIICFLLDHALCT